MTAKSQIRSSQAGLVIFSATIGTIFLPLAGIVVPYAGTSSWWIIIAVFLTAAAWIPLAAWLGRQVPLNNFGQAARAWLGSFFGIIFLLWFAAYWLLLAIGLLAEIGLVFHAIALPNTPPGALIIFLFVLIIYTERRGIDACLRTSQILLFLSAPLLLGFLISAFAASEPKNMLPLLDARLPDLLKSSYLTAPYPLIGILLTLFLSLKVEDKKNLGPCAACAIWSAGLVLSTVVAVTIGVLGPSATKVFFYPTLPLTRCINVGETLQGVELFVYPLWLMFAYTITALSFTLAVSAVTGLWPRLPRLYASLGLGSVVLIPALALPNIYTVTHLFSATCYCLSLPFYLALPLAAAAVKIKKQRKRK